MRTKDIKIGEAYAINPGYSRRGYPGASWLHKATVVSIQTGGGAGATVTVRFDAPGGVSIEPRKVICTWAEHEAMLAAWEAEREARQGRAKSEAARALAAYNRVLAIVPDLAEGNGLSFRVPGTISSMDPGKVELTWTILADLLEGVRS